jgi:hypothetical protein
VSTVSLASARSARTPYLESNVDPRQRVIDELLEQVMRDLKTLDMDLTYQMPSPKFYVERINEYLAEIARLRRQRPSKEVSE